MNLFRLPVSLVLLGVLPPAVLPLCGSPFVLMPHSADREAVVWRMPNDRRNTFAGLRDDDGREYPLQAMPGGTRVVIVPHVPADARMVFEPVERGVRPSGGVAWREEKGALVAVVGRRDLFTFHVLPASPPEGVDPIYARSGFFHPIRTRSGHVVTGAFPPGHEHHYGLWSAWTRTGFEGREMNFWSVGEGKTQVRCDGVTSRWEGSVAGGFVARNTWYDRTVQPEKAALHETIKVTAYHLPDELEYGLFDVTLVQTTAGNSPVTLREYPYGGFAVRGNEAFAGAQGTHILTSTGETDREKANATGQHWTYLGGVLDGRQVGLAILAHPGNFRSPTPVRIHPRDPYLVFSPSIQGDWSIEPRRPYTAMYRIVVLEGEPDRRQLEALWQAFAVAP